MIINKKIHNVEISNLEKVNKLLLKRDLDANILIIDQNLKSNKYIKKLISKFGPRCLLIKGHEKIKSLDSLKIKDIGLIMIDTEGYELNVLKGAVSTIKKYKPVLVLEFHTTKKNTVNNLTQKFGYSLSELQNYVENLGYQSIGYLNKVDQIFISK